MTRKILFLILCFSLILQVGGVFATWRYAEISPQPTEQTVNLAVSPFEYPPEEILPGGEMEEAELGQNHFALIDLILNESNKGYGLNYNNNVVLHQYLKKQAVVYSNQKVSGGNLKFILDPKNNTHGLYYCIEKVSETEYYAYTFSVDELSTSSGSDTEIIAYRTALVKDGKWKASASYLGFAKTKSLSALGVSADPNTISYSIDVTTWHPQYS